MAPRSRASGQTTERSLIFRRDDELYKVGFASIDKKTSPGRGIRAGYRPENGTKCLFGRGSALALDSSAVTLCRHGVGASAPWSALPEGLSLRPDPNTLTARGRVVRY